MPAHKGHAKAGGRAKGTVNKSTQNAREAIARLVDGNADKLIDWLETVAAGIPLKDKHGNQVYSNEDQTPRYLVKPDPQGAFAGMAAVLEFHVPKLQRTTHEGGDKPIAFNVTWDK